MIEVKILTKIFNDYTAVNNISFTVEHGEALILPGTSGYVIQRIMVI